jgi:ribosomal protein L29
MKKDDLTTKTAAELQHQLEETSQKLAQMRFDLADKKLKRTSDIARARKLIARLMTALRTAK